MAAEMSPRDTPSLEATGLASLLKTSFACRDGPFYASFFLPGWEWKVRRDGRVTPLLYVYELHRTAENGFRIVETIGKATATIVLLPPHHGGEWRSDVYTAWVRDAYDRLRLPYVMLATSKVPSHRVALREYARRYPRLGS